MVNDNQEKLLKLAQCPFNQCILICGMYVISDQMESCKPYPDSHQHTFRCQKYSQFDNNMTERARET